VIAGVADTHTALWYLLKNPRLSSAARSFMDDAARASIDDPDFVLEEAPLTAEVIEAMRQVPRADVPDLPDRIVAATALYFGVPLISRDGRIRASDIHTVW
jgi:PIN domain nuclease of toxin-antitoxin system